MVAVVVVPELHQAQQEEDIEVMLENAHEVEANCDFPPYGYPLQVRNRKEKFLYRCQTLHVRCRPTSLILELP